MSDERLRNDFDGCVTLYQDYIRQTSKTKTNATVNISEVKTHGGKQKASAVKDCYYTKDEYNDLSPEQKKELASKRLKRGHKPGAKDSKTKGTSGKGSKDVIKNLKVMNRRVAQLAERMGKAGVKDDDTDSSTRTGSVADKNNKTTNRNNPSLTRQKRVTINDFK